MDQAMVIRKVSLCYLKKAYGNKHRRDVFKAFRFFLQGNKHVH